MSSPAENSAPRNSHETVQVIANGRTVSIQTPATLTSLLVNLGLPPRSVVVEHNGDAVAPSEFDTRTVGHGDRLEIVRITAGG